MPTKKDHAFSSEELAEINKSLQGSHSVFCIITTLENHETAHNHDVVCGDMNLALNGLFGAMEKDEDIRQLLMTVVDEYRKKHNLHDIGPAPKLNSLNENQQAGFEATFNTLNDCDGAVIITIKKVEEKGRLGFWAKGKRLELSQAFAGVFNQDDNFRVIVEHAFFQHQLQNGNDGKQG